MIFNETTRKLSAATTSFLLCIPISQAEGLLHFPVFSFSEEAGKKTIFFLVKKCKMHRIKGDPQATNSQVRKGVVFCKRLCTVLTHMILFVYTTLCYFWMLFVKFKCYIFGKILLQDTWRSGICYVQKQRKKVTIFQKWYLFFLEDKNKMFTLPCLEELLWHWSHSLHWPRKTTNHIPEYAMKSGVEITSYKATRWQRNVWDNYCIWQHRSQYIWQLLTSAILAPSLVFTTRCSSSSHRSVLLPMRTKTVPSSTPSYGTLILRQKRS